MVTALLLIFDPSGTWERIAQTPRQQVGRVFFGYLLPILLLATAGEAFGMLKFGVEEEGLMQRVMKPTQQLVLRYEAVQLLLDVVIIFGGAWLLQKMAEGFHRRHSYSDSFAVLGYSLGPYYLLRL